MASLGEMGKFLNPLLHYLKKMELELTCPSCSFVSCQPTLLNLAPHVVCSQCVVAKNHSQYECPVCIATFLRGDVRHVMQMEKVINTFKNLDDATVPIVQKLGPQGIKVPSKGLGNPLSRRYSTKERAPDGQFDDSGKEHAKEDPKEGMEGDNHRGISNTVNVGIPVDGGESRELASFSRKRTVDISAKDRRINWEELSIPPSPHDFKNSETNNYQRSGQYTGPIVHYANGKAVGPEEFKQSKVKHFHLKCFEWAPQAYFEGETAMNMESELARASKISCSHCGQMGAAIGCYVGCCLKSYHLPCAVELPCRWNLIGYSMLCPSHSSCKFPNELEWGINPNHSLLPHDKSKTRKTTEDKRCSAHIDNSNFLEEQCDEVWMAEPGVHREWVLCGSDLSTAEMELLNIFANFTGATVARMWKPNVTHVIASTNENGACNRTQTFLMAILSGKWVLTIDWIMASMAARYPLSEESYEVTLDCYGISDGPRKGRMRADLKEPKVFTGLSFYLSDQFERLYRGFLEEMVLIGGGTVLKNVDLVTEGSEADVFPLGSSFIVYNEDPPRCKYANLEEVANWRCDDVEALVGKTGFKVIGHTRLLDHVAACSSAADLQNAAVQ